MKAQLTGRILSILLVMLLVFPAAPLTAFAEGSETGSQETGNINSFDAPAEEASVPAEEAKEQNEIAEREKANSNEGAETSILDSTKTLTALIPFYVSGQTLNWDGTIDSGGFTEGSGTAVDPYIVETPQQLAYLAQQVNANNTTLKSAHYKMVNNFVLSGYNWTPIGNLYNRNFTGTFDGDGCSISGLQITATTTNQGLFGYFGNNATAKNLTITNANISATNGTAGLLAGTIAGNCTVTNCHVSGKVQGTSALGGIGGMASSGTVIEDCTATVDISGAVDTGGLIGSANNVTVTNCTVSGTVTDTTGAAGGLVGFASGNGGSFIDCTANMTVFCAGGFAGGFIGAANNVAITVTNCTATGDVTSGGNYTGGLVGYHLGNGVYTNCSATGNVDSSGGQTGGFVGLGSNNKYYDCSAAGTVEGEWSTGGFAGAGDFTTLDGCSATGNVTSYDWNAGGLVGYGEGATITNCFASGNVTSIPSWDARAGGLVGYAEGTHIDGSYATGNVSVNSTMGGGLVGYDHMGSTISLSYASGNVYSANGNAGGLIGLGSSTSISDSYATGDVSTNGDYAGGLAGYLTSATLSRVYSAGHVTAGSSSNYIGAFIGTDQSSAAITSCYYDKMHTTQNAFGAGNVDGAVTALETYQMTRENAVLAMTGLDFTSTWWESGANNVAIGYYPQLRLFKNSTTSAIQTDSLESVMTEAYYKLTFNGNGGTDSVSATSALVWTNYGGAPDASKVPVFTLSGKHFNGWNTAADGGGISYSSVAGYSMLASDTVLYAVWASSCTVTYDANSATSGFAPLDGTTYLSGNPVTIRGNTGSLARTGYSFAGWTKDSGGSSTVYIAGDTFTIAENTTLYAKWMANDYGYTVEYRIGSVVGTLLDSYTSTAAFDTQVTAQPKTFSGYTKQPGQNTIITMGISGNTIVVLYDVAVEYTVTFDSKGGTTVANQTIESGKTITKPTDPTQAGYTFGGWFSDEKLTQAWDFNNDTVTGNMTLHAKWTAASNPTATGNSTHNPATGDNGTLWLVLALLGVCGLGIIGIALARKKKLPVGNRKKTSAFTE